MMDDIEAFSADVLPNWEYYPNLVDAELDVVPEVVLTPSEDVCVELMAPDYLSESERHRLNLTISPFRSIFTKQPGLCKLYQHSINTENHYPVTENLRPMTSAKRKVFDETFYELIKYDVIEPSKSPWCSNAFVVPKTDGSQRFVINYKPLNAITVPDAYPMSRMDDMLAILGQCRYFSTFDLAKGFYQIQMKDEDKQKTAFICHHGLWQFKRLPMGLRNSPATFVRCIDQVLGDLKWKICAVYFDDIIIFSRTLDEHLEHIRLVLSRLKDAGLTINPKKVQLCRQKLKFLGHVIQPGKCQPNPEKIEILRNYPVPKNATQVMQFLGLIGFYRRFVLEFARYARPLHALTKKDAKFIWNEEAQKSFDFLKQTLTELTEMYLPDLNEPFIIQCDASDKGLGAVLVQEKEGKRFPIWFASRSLKGAEMRYSTSEKECLAVLWAIEKFRGYVEYSHFVVETDHQALQWLQKIKEPSGRLARWFFTLQMYDFEVRYKPGDSPNIRGADALSRIPAVLMLEDENFDLSSMKKSQEEDPVLGDVIRFMITSKSDHISVVNEQTHLNTSERCRLETIIKRCFITPDGLLMYYVGPRGKVWEEECLHWRIWVPQSMTRNIISLFHSTVTSGHLGIRKTFHRLECRVYWKNLRRDVVSFVNSCKRCQLAKVSKIPPAPASSFHSQIPWDIITVDLMGPYPKGSNQSTFLLVIVDMLTKYVEIFPLRNAKTEVVTQKLWLVCCRWGVPRTVLSDNGTQFTSNHFTDWCKLLGIKPFYISAYHPQANLTERYNQTIKSMIVACLETCKQWDKSIPELQFALNTAVNDSTQFSAAYLNFGRELRTPFDNMLNVPLSSCKSVAEMSRRMELVISIARDNNLHSTENALVHYNKRAKEREINVGDKVLLKSHFLSDASREFTSKLADKKEGPFLVTEKLTEKTFNLKSISSGQIVCKVHINELSPFRESLHNVRKERVERQLSTEPTALHAILSKSEKSQVPDSSVLLPTDVPSRCDALVSSDATTTSEEK
jgi:transposase InsO family protein